MLIALSGSSKQFSCEFTPVGERLEVPCCVPRSERVDNIVEVSEYSTVSGGQDGHNFLELLQVPLPDTYDPQKCEQVGFHACGVHRLLCDRHKTMVWCQQ